MLRWIGRIFIGLVVLIVGAFAYAAFFLADPVVPRDTLVKKYGGSPSKFIKLPSGAEAHYRDQGNAAGLPLILLHGSTGRRASRHQRRSARARPDRPDTKRGLFDRGYGQVRR
jgi:hypothetical protein